MSNVATDFVFKASNGLLLGIYCEGTFESSSGHEPAFIVLDRIEPYLMTDVEDSNPIFTPIDLYEEPIQREIKEVCQGRLFDQAEKEGFDV